MMSCKWKLSSRDRRVDLLSLNDALERFEHRDPDKALLIKLRYFAGLTIPKRRKPWAFLPPPLIVIGLMRVRGCMPSCRGIVEPVENQTGPTFFPESMGASPRFRIVSGDAQRSES